MSGHLVLSGGPGHDFDVTTAELGALSSEIGLATTVVTEPTEFFTALRCNKTEAAPRWDLVTVNALRWRMETGRYADQADRLAFTLNATDATTLEHHVTGGGGLVVLHTGVICFDAEPTWHRLAGATWNWASSSHPPAADVAVTLTIPGRDHPVTAGVEPFVVHDEMYRDLDVADGVVPLLSASNGTVEYPLLWARPFGAGRVVTDVLGHGVESLRHPTHRAVLLRALAWCRRGSADAG